jgi:hypothetical protein
LLDEAPHDLTRAFNWAGAISLPRCCHPFCGQQWSLLYTLVHCGTTTGESMLCISVTEHP